MSRRRPWLRFERRGGRPPREDEELTVAVGGTFTARRTIGGPRIGTFEGQLSKGALSRLAAAVEAVAAAGDLTIPTPRDGATEVLEASGRTLQLGSNEDAPKPWRALLDRVRKLFEDEILESPRAALELVADTRQARLVHAGDAPVEVDMGSVAVRLIRVADDGAVLARWEGRTAGLMDKGEELVPTPAWATAEPGWSASLPFDHPLELAAGDMLQVWVDVPIRDGDGARDGQLYAPVEHDG